jgi:hypothetical protein
MTWMSTPSRSACRPRGIGDAFGAVEEVARRLRVQHHAPVGLEAVAAETSRCSMSSSSIRRPPMSISTGTMRLARPGARAADPHAGDVGPGELLGALDRVAHGVSRGGHIGHVAAADPLRRAMAAAEHDHLAALGQPGDHRRDTERADIDRPEHARDAWTVSRLAGHQVPSPDALARNSCWRHSGQRT